MKAIALLAVLALFAQTLKPSPQDLLNLARPLTPAEIATVLTESRRTLTAKTFRLSFAPGGRGLDILMAPGGQPKMVRRIYGLEGGIAGGIVSSSPGGATEPAPTSWREEIISIVDFTGGPARRCDGSTEPGEMAIEYEHRSSTNAWTAAARARSTRDVGGPGIAPVFEMLLGAATASSGERRQIGAGWARAFVSPWVPPRDQPFAEILTGDPMPNLAGQLAPSRATQSLWIDTESALPVRWEVSEGGKISHAVNFTYEPIDLRPPADVDTPECIR
jgi:hypothetical protein